MRDVAESGIAIPILITQLIGYAAALTVTLVTVVLYLCKVPENTLWIVIFVITGVNFLQTIIITLAFERVSVLRKRRNYKPKNNKDNYEKFNVTNRFYELTMMYGYFLQGKQDEVATFDLFFRPFEESNFCIAAGLEQAVEYVNNLHFTKEDIEYLRSTKAFNDAFLSWLSDFRFTEVSKPYRRER